MAALTTAPLWLIAFILLVPTTIFAMAGPVIVRRYVPLEHLRTNNEVAGFKFATVGVVYAVLLAFAIIVVWERFNQAEGDVAKEASAAATIFRLAAVIDPDHAAAVRKATGDYLKAAIEKDWPAMNVGKASPEASAALGAIYGAVLKFHAFEPSESLALGEILRSLDNISAARRERLVTSDGIVPGIIWTVLFIGAFLTVAFTFFFGTTNLKAQVMMSGALSIMIFAGLMTIMVIDHPFAGSIRVGPDALVHVLQDLWSVPPP